MRRQPNFFFLPLFFVIIMWRAPLSAAVASSASASPLSLVKIGAMLCLNSGVGKASQQAMQMAVDSINSNHNYSSFANVSLLVVDTNCSAFQGAAAAIELLKEEVVAVVGPQSSQVAHFVAQMGGAAQVPFVSFAVTDSSLSESRYPYFWRMPPSGSAQMAAIAAVIGYYGWREIVAIFSDNDHGADGIAELSSALALVNAEVRIVGRKPVPPGTNRSGMNYILTEVDDDPLETVHQPRVFVVHMQQDAETLFAEADHLKMMSEGYAWIVTDSFLANVDITTSSLKSMEGIIGTRLHVPDSAALDSFMAEWKACALRETDASDIIYALHAYDSIHLITAALDTHLRKGGKLEFQDSVLPPTVPGGTSDLAKLRIFKGGPQLREQIINTKFDGISGPVQVDTKGDPRVSVFEIINTVQKAKRVIGYWSNQTGLSKAIGNASKETANAKLLESIWPGGSTKVPRGWVLPKRSKPLIIGVPYKAVGYEQFTGWTTTMDANDSAIFTGFCIDVFEHALKQLPYDVPYKFILIGNGSSMPVYDDMIEKLAAKEMDGIVGDITITTKRMERVDFTQPYIDAGLVVVVPYRDSDHSYAWAFLQPFTPAMWFTTSAFFIFTGIVIWMLEHKKNRDFRGRPKKQIVTILWYSFSTLFFSHRETTKSILGRCVIIIWMFVVLILSSSYTASLTSILTIKQLSPSIQGISSLQASNVPIGYRAGSFVEDYLIGLNVAKERLRSYNSVKEYAQALTLGPSRGGVSAIVDELPYAQVFLSSQCGFTLAGHEFTKGGWGFAFPKGSELAMDMTNSILSISENGELQKLHGAWLSGSDCNNDGSVVDSTQLGLNSFWGLYLVTGVASVTCLTIYTARLLCQFRQKALSCDSISSSSRSIKGSLPSRSFKLMKSFALYVNESALDDSGERKKAKPEEDSVAHLSYRSEAGMNSFSCLSELDESQRSKSSPLQSFRS